MKTLIIVTHPNLVESVVNKRWIEELKKYPEKYHVHDLYNTYPDGVIDVNREQKMIESFDKIVFQFPLYWFSSPPLLKKWFDEVLTYGWAYGSKSGFKVGGKKVTLAMSTGIDEKDYLPTGRYIYTLQELTKPFEVSFRYIKADYQPFYAYYGVEQNPSLEDIEDGVQKYINFLELFSI